MAKIVQPLPESVLRVLGALVPDRMKKVMERPWKTYLDIWERLMFHKSLIKVTPVFIYQMAKVGSTSIYRSLSEQYPGAVLHAHMFSAVHHDWRIRSLYRWVFLPNRPLNIISPIREPIGRNVSGFFEDFEKYTGVPYEKSKFTIDELKNIFLANYKHNWPLEWFDTHILKDFGIDVYATPFLECGFATYSQKNNRLLVMRSELADQDKARVIKQFLGMFSFQLFNSNVGENKEYAKMYREFRNKVKLPKDYLAKMCGSKYFNHFYSQETIDQARRKWADTGGEARVERSSLS